MRLFLRRTLLSVAGLWLLLPAGLISAAGAEDIPTESTVRLHKPLPESLTSFGAAVLGDYLYVFSGHSGDAHGFGKDMLVNHFRRIEVDNPEAEWQELAMHEPAQSVSIVTDGEFIYRIAGLSFENTADEDTEFRSTACFAKYDPVANEWTDLAPLPEPRSSLDAAVVGRKIFVAGGWNLQGESSRDAEWRDDILCFELDQPEASWKSIDGPGYQTRALSVAAHRGRFYVLGGIQQRGMTRKVSVFDPDTASWSEGPELRADARTAGFATSSFAVGGHLYYTGSSGVLYRLSDSEDAWDVVDRLMFPRMFLRLLPLGEDRLLAVGGTGSLTGRTSLIESIQVPGEGATVDRAAVKTVRWSVPFEGRADHGQTLLLDGTKLYAFGGNASAEPHDFSESAFVREAFAFDVARQTVERLPDLPVAMQAAAAVVNSQTSEHKSIVTTGGMGFVDGQFQALDCLLEYNPESQEWNRLTTTLPQPRAMHHSVVYDGAVWTMGGSQPGHQGELPSSLLHWWGDQTDVARLPDVKLDAPRRSFGAVVADDLLYVCGGLAADSQIPADLVCFNFVDRTWSSLPAPQYARVFPQLVHSGDKLYLFGGFARQEGHFAPVDVLEVFDVPSGKWSQLPTGQLGVRSSMNLFAMGGRLLFFGLDKSSAKADFVLYDPSPTAEPETVAPMSFAARGSSADEARSTARMLFRKDSDRDGRLSVAEAGARLQDFFERADDNADGFLTLTEATAAMQEESAQESSQGAEE